MMCFCNFCEVHNDYEKIASTRRRHSEIVELHCSMCSIAFHRTLSKITYAYDDDCCDGVLMRLECDIQLGDVSSIGRRLPWLTRLPIQDTP